MDNYIYELWMRQVKRWYPKKSIKWIVNKHFKTSNHPQYKWKWTFTDPTSGYQVDRMSWIKIKYPFIMKYGATPYDYRFDKYFQKESSRTSFECLFGR